MDKYTTEEARIEDLIAREQADTYQYSARSVSTQHDSRAVTHAPSHFSIEGDPYDHPLTQSPLSAPIDLTTDLNPGSVHNGHDPRRYWAPNHQTLPGSRQVVPPGFYPRADSLQYTQRSNTDPGFGSRVTIDLTHNQGDSLLTFQSQGQAPTQHIYGSSPPVWPESHSAANVSPTLPFDMREPSSRTAPTSSPVVISSPLLQRRGRRTRLVANARSGRSIRTVASLDSILSTGGSSPRIDRSRPPRRARFMEPEDSVSRTEKVSVDELMERELGKEARNDILLAEAIASQVDIEVQDDWITRRFIRYCRGALSTTLNLEFEDHVKDFAFNRKPYTEDIIIEYVNHSRRHRRAWYADWQRSVNLDEAKPCMPCFHERGKFRCDGQGHICTSL